MEATTQKPIKIQPKFIFGGPRTDIIGNIHFAQTQEVIFPVAGVLSIQDCINDKQKFLRFNEKSRIESIAISPNRKFLAISEIIGDCSYVNIYEIATLKKRKSITIPAECPTRQAGRMCFTHESKAIAFLTKEPDAYLCIFMFDRAESMFIGRVSNSSQIGRAFYVACNPGDPSIFALGGDHMLKVINKTEKGFGQMGGVKADALKVVSLIWLTSEVLLAGTRSNELLLVEAGDLKMRFKADAVEFIDLTKIQDEETQMQVPSQTSLLMEKTEGVEPEPMDVMCLTYFEKGFAYAINNVVYVFEQEMQMRYRKKSLITIPVTLYAEKLYKITNLAINAQQDTIIVTAKHPQIYIGMLYVPETLNVTALTFKTFGEALHIDQIVDLDVCGWKTIVMTASKDQTIRIWNYKTMKIELIMQYQVDISVISLHPSGLFVAVGFSDRLRFMQIQLSELQLVRMFSCRSPSAIRFSHQGHFLAAAHEKRIDIISIFTFKNIHTLTGHNGKIISVAWSADDKYLVSSGVDGAIYQWDVATGARMHEVIMKGTEYRDLVLSNDGQGIIAVTNTGFLRELANSKISREFKAPEMAPLTSLALSNSNAVLFIASETGHLFNVQLPFADTGGGTLTNFRFFHTSVSKICMTPDDKMLITAAGETLVIWTIQNNEGKIAPIEHGLGECVDVMIPREQLIKLNSFVKNLELRIEQQSAEFQYQMQQSDTQHLEGLKEVHTEYIEAIEGLKRRNDNMAARHVEELNILTANIAQDKDEHLKVLADVEAKFHQKIIAEYEKADSIKSQTNEMRARYEDELKAREKLLVETRDSMAMDAKQIDDDRQKLIKTLVCELEEKKKDFEEYCKQVECDHDRNLIELQLNYEKRLRDETETGVKAHSEANIMRQLQKTTLANYEEAKGEIATLQAQQANFQKTIQGLQSEVEGLKKDITTRETTIRNRDLKIVEVEAERNEARKLADILQRKNDEIKHQIEPRDLEIRKHRQRILEMEAEQAQLEKTIKSMKVQLSEMKDKFVGTDMALKVERKRAQTARQHASLISSDIHKVSAHIQKPSKLKAGVRKLYQTYAEDSELKQQLLKKAEINEEFSRQRAHLEMVAMAKKKKTVKKKDDVDTSKLLRDNVELIAELNKLRSELQEVQKAKSQMESILNISGRVMKSQTAKEMLRKAVADTTELEERHKEECQKFEELIKTVTSENRTLKLKIAKMNRRD